MYVRTYIRFDTFYLSAASVINLEEFFFWHGVRALISEKIFLLSDYKLILEETFECLNSLPPVVEGVPWKPEVKNSMTSGQSSLANSNILI